MGQTNQCKGMGTFECIAQRTTAQSLVFWIEEGGLGWDRMAVTLFPQCDRKLLNS